MATKGEKAATDAAKDGNIDGNVDLPKDPSAETEPGKDNAPHGRQVSQG